MANINDKQAFYSWDTPEDLAEISKGWELLGEEDHFVSRGLPQSAYGHTSRYRDFQNIDPNISVRSPYSRSDYDYFRPNESLPQSQKAIMGWAMSAYKENGLLKNIIDLMGDFTCQGIRLVHPVKRIQRFYDNWWKMIQGKNRTERMANMFFRTGTVVIRRKTGKLKFKEKRTAFAKPDEDKVDFKNLPEMEKNEIPIQYIIHNPMNLVVVAEELAAFAGKIMYAIKLPKGIARRMKNFGHHHMGSHHGGNISQMARFEQKLMKSLPKQVRDALIRGDDLLMLDENKIETMYYKKDDWELWGQPMVMAIVKDVILLEKMKLADMTALDGIISSVRLWRLGSLEHKIMPAPGSIRKLTNILIKNTAGGAYDLVWGPEIDFKESSSESYKSLGKEKYEPALNAIYAGLGIPPTLTGSASQSGFTNNFISLKTLIERLNYARDAMVEFWNKEVAIVQRAMGFRLPAKITFDHMTLSDETAERALLIQLWDRNVVSTEAVLERFKEDPEMERIRLIGEIKDRKKEKMAPKAGPWFTPEKDHEYKKILTQLGELSPEELDLDLMDVEVDEDRVMNKRKEKLQVETEDKKLQEMKQRNTGQPQQGRPNNSKDSSKRKQKEVKPRQKVSTPKKAVADLLSTCFWAGQAYLRIEKMVNPGILKSMNKTKMVALTSEELHVAHNIKYAALLSLRPFESFTKKSLGQSMKQYTLSAEDVYTLQEVVLGMRDNTEHFQADDFRQCNAYAYSLLNLGVEGDIEVNKEK